MSNIFQIPNRPDRFREIGFSGPSHRWISLAVFRGRCLTGLKSKEVGSQAKDNPCHVLQVTPEWSDRTHEPARSLGFTCEPIM